MDEELTTDEPRSTSDGVLLTLFIIFMCFAGIPIMLGLMIVSPFIDEWQKYKKDPRPFRVNFDGFGESLFKSIAFLCGFPFVILMGSGLQDFREMLAGPNCSGGFLDYD